MEMYNAPRFYQSDHSKDKLSKAAANLLKTELRKIPQKYFDYHTTFSTIIRGLGGIYDDERNDLVNEFWYRSKIREEIQAHQIALWLHEGWAKNRGGYKTLKYFLPAESVRAVDRVL
nr:hypothetical protein [Abalone asfa-like virus]